MSFLKERFPLSTDKPFFVSLGMSSVQVWPWGKAGLAAAHVAAHVLGVCSLSGRGSGSRWGWRLPQPCPETPLLPCCTCTCLLPDWGQSQGFLSDPPPAFCTPHPARLGGLPSSPAWWTFWMFGRGLLAGDVMSPPLLLVWRQHGLPWFTCVVPGHLRCQEPLRDRLASCQMWLARDQDSMTTGHSTLQRSACKDSGMAVMWPWLVVKCVEKKSGRRGWWWQAGWWRRGALGREKSCHVWWNIQCCPCCSIGCFPQGGGFLDHSSGPLVGDWSTLFNRLAVLIRDICNALPEVFNIGGRWKVQVGIIVCQHHTHACMCADGSLHPGQTWSLPKMTFASSTPPF